MSHKNICKSVPPYAPRGIMTKRFILESSLQAMTEEHRLSAHRMILIMSGEGNFYFNGEPVGFGSGTLLFGFDGERIYAEPMGDEPCEFMYIDFSGDRAKELFHRFGVHPEFRRFDGFEGVLPFWKESLSRAGEQNIDLSTESVLLYTFSRFSTEMAEENNVVSRVVKVLEESFSNPDLCLYDVSQELSYNTKYISHIFKKRMGIGFSKYLRTVRLKYAVSLFDYGLDSVKNVALLSGFSDSMYFSTVFKKELGISPLDYVKQVKIKSTPQN